MNIAITELVWMSKFLPSFISPETNCFGWLVLAYNSTRLRSDSVAAPGSL